MSERAVMTLLGAVQGMLEAEVNFAEGLGDTTTGSEVAALRDQRDRARKLVAAHTYLLLGHLQSGDRGNVDVALAQLRELALYLKEPT